jgi:NADH-quinone oxidoreductase subunit J
VGSLIAATSVGTAETVVFWVLAPIALLAAVAMVLARSAVHGALFLVVDLFCLAVFYAVQDAPFLAAVQITVYAGAIMVLFLFVLMLVGVDRSDSLVETLRGQRVAAVLLSLGFAGLLAFGIGDAVLDMESVGLEAANREGNVLGIARLLFTDYVFVFEATSALLIVAALGAMVLAHKERTGPRPTQRSMSQRRFDRGTTPAGPGVYADTQDPHEPALLPSGAPADDSVATGGSVGGGQAGAAGEPGGGSA